MLKRLASRPWLTIPVLILITLLAYWPGLYGGFLFDDFANLPALGALGPIDNWPNFLRYITSGGSDPVGRPIALLSFLANAHDWPADPFPFKCTNVALHLFNGILLIFLLRSLGHSAYRSTESIRVDLAAMLGSAYWMLQPLLASTTLYIIQRETLLSASFVLLGLLSWLHGRTVLQRGQHAWGLLWISLGLGLCTILATLSKANGILLPIMALVLEYTFLRTYSPFTSQNSRATHRRTLLLLAWAPAGAITIYLTYQGWYGITHGLSSVRPWTLEQRLITEPRILLGYLQQLWLPRPFTAGLFNDQVQASTSLWMPATTLPALLAALTLIVGACLTSHRWPAIALAILFYFAGHLLESSTIPLELYFEHRNYLPATMMYWPLALWLCNLAVRSPRTAHAVAFERASKAIAPSPLWGIGKPTFAIILLIGLALMTHAGAQLWGNSRDQAILWAKLNPASPRAQANAAIVETNLGHPELAILRLRAALVNSANEAQLSLTLFTAECLLGHIDRTTLSSARTSLLVTRDTGPFLLNWFKNKIVQLQRPSCPELNAENLNNLLGAALDNPRLMAINGRREDLYHLQGQLALAQGDANLALHYFNKALDQQVDVQAALKQAAQLGESGFPSLGLAHLDYYEHERQLPAEPGFGMPRIHAWLLQRQQYWPHELARLRATLSADVSRRSRLTDESTSSPR